MGEGSYIRVLGKEVTNLKREVKQLSQSIGFEESKVRDVVKSVLIEDLPVEALVNEVVSLRKSMGELTNKKFEAMFRTLFKGEVPTLREMIQQEIAKTTAGLTREMSTVRMDITSTREKMVDWKATTSKAIDTELNRIRESAAAVPDVRSEIRDILAKELSLEAEMRDSGIVEVRLRFNKDLLGEVLIGLDRGRLKVEKT